MSTWRPLNNGGWLTRWYFFFVFVAVVCRVLVKQIGHWGNEESKTLGKKGERGKSSQSSWPTFFKQNKKLSISQIPSKVMSSDLQFGLIVWSGHLNNKCKNNILMSCRNADPKGPMKENPRRYVSQSGVSQIWIMCVVALLLLHYQFEKQLNSVS